MTKEEAAFKVGFRAGFEITQEGFNAECPFWEHAPEPALGENIDEVLNELADAAWNDLQRKAGA